MHYHRQLAITAPTRQFALLTFLAWVAFAETPPIPRPKIGVAFEGGGALGLAHVGVLQWFEEHHIPVDYIAGTSMGGLVGGLYSTGLRPTELRDLVSAMDWTRCCSVAPLG